MGAEPGTPGRRSSAIKKGILGFAAAVVVVGIIGGGYWALACPCGGVPGFALRGVVHREPVQDWRFANDVSLCQIQIDAGSLPHSVNLNCMATPVGDLFLSCSAGTRKYWCQHVGADHPGRLRLNGTVYPVVLNRVTDPAPSPDARRPDTWWSVQVRSRASS